MTFFCFVLKIIEKYLKATGEEGLVLIDVWEVDRDTEVHLNIINNNNDIFILQVKSLCT